MDVINDRTGGSLRRETNSSIGSKETAIACFRCGICCIKYNPRITVTEAHNIAGALGISLEEFRDRYVDGSWFEPGYFVLESHDGPCIFLEHKQESRLASCLIHPVRPRVCREWQPGWHRRECREGLRIYWGLSVDPSGELEGPGEKINDFRNSLQSPG